MRETARSSAPDFFATSAVASEELLSYTLIDARGNMRWKSSTTAPIVDSSFKQGMQTAIDFEAIHD